MFQKLRPSGGRRVVGSAGQRGKEAGDTLDAALHLMTKGVADWRGVDASAQARPADLPVSEQGRRRTKIRPLAQCRAILGALLLLSVVGRSRC
ncbi:hypothetical protein CFB45_04275 [Burkholderia sp. HI2500]|nr:hypothetical protein CFB45_04275 [Burkholderia sp. HI2500]